MLESRTLAFSSLWQEVECLMVYYRICYPKWRAVVELRGLTPHISPAHLCAHQDYLLICPGRRLTGRLYSKHFGLLPVPALLLFLTQPLILVSITRPNTEMHSLKFTEVYLTLKWLLFRLPVLPLNFSFLSLQHLYFLHLPVSWFS